MAKARLSMRKIRETLRLTYQCGLTRRQVARSINASRSTVAEYLWRAEQAGLRWPLPEEFTDQELEERLFPPSPATVPRAAKLLPDFEYVYRELKAHKKFNLTLDLLWREYKEQHPDDGYQYSQFCELYRRWIAKLDFCMRQDHRGGEKLFVDYAEGLNLVDPKTGQPIGTQFFVAVWGASNYTYAEATLTQQLPDWIGSHVRAFSYFGCVPKAVVPDCLKGAVSRACRYEPELNPTYAEMAEHYRICVLPARPAHPRDKAKVETGVLIAKRWILCVLRHRTFYGLGELNRTIQDLLERLNTRLLRKFKKSRCELFETFDRPNAQDLPERPYQYAEWRVATVNIDYHIEVERHYYSVPYQLLREKLDVRLTAGTIEAFCKGERVAAHVRSFIPYGHTTLKEHMPPSHQKYLEWTPSRMVDWAKKTGPQTAELVQKIIQSRTYPEQAYRSCLGILRLEKHYPKERLEKAARRALKFGSLSLRSLRNILRSGLDRLEENDPRSEPALSAHENIRGSHYYH
jgi:transposase